MCVHFFQNEFFFSFENDIGNSIERITDTIIVYARVCSRKRGSHYANARVRVRVRNKFVKLISLLVFRSHRRYADNHWSGAYDPLQLARLTG